MGGLGFHCTSDGMSMYHQSMAGKLFCRLMWKVGIAILQGKKSLHQDLVQHFFQLWLHLIVRLCSDAPHFVNTCTFISPRCLCFVSYELLKEQRFGMNYANLIEKPENGQRQNFSRVALQLGSVTLSSGFLSPRPWAHIN